jgi:hypothetical protein
MQGKKYFCFDLNIWLQGCQNRTGPVEPGIGPASGPADAQKRSARGPEKKPLKPGKTEKKNR